MITIPEMLTIKELADHMKIQPSVIVKKLFMQGKIVTLNQEIDFETAEEIAMEFEVICEKEEVVDVIEELLKYAETRPDYKIADDNREGIRISTENGFFILRMSVHDPVMPFNTESNSPNGCVEICKSFYDLVKNVKGIDFTPVQEFINLQ